MDVSTGESAQLSKKERRQLRRQEKKERIARTEKKNSSKIPIILGAIVLAGGFIIWAVLASGGGSGEANRQSASVVVNSIEEGIPTRGDPQAPVTIVEYADFQCPICNRFFRDAWPQIEDAYINTGKAKLVYKDFQFIGADSQRAGEAAQCANEQGKFWEYHDTLYNYIWDNYYARGVNGENKGAFTKDNLKDFASQLGLDTEQFNSCVDSRTYKKVVDSNKGDGSRQGVRGTPTFFIGGQKIVGAQPFSVFAQIIESKLP